MIVKRLLIISLLTTLTSGCENFSSSTQAVSPAPNYQKVVLATPKPAPTVPPASASIPKSLPHKKGPHVLGTTAVDEANKNAVIQPSSASTIHSIIVYPFEAGELYQIYTTPLNVTDVEFQVGEEIISVAAGDTARWQISKTLSGGGDTGSIQHLLIKPSAEGLDTTLVVTTSQRTYHMLLKSTKNTFMSTVQWQYSDTPTDEDASSASNDNLSLNSAALDFSYTTKLRHGDKPDWMPKAIFNDGSKTYIEFPDHIQSAPTLFIKQSGSGDAAVNYRVVGHYYVIDQVMTSAELTSGIDKYQTIVEIDYKK